MDKFRSFLNRRKIKKVVEDNVLDVVTSYLNKGECPHCGYNRDREMYALKMKNETFIFVDYVEGCPTYSEEENVTTFYDEERLNDHLERIKYEDMKNKERGVGG